MNENEFSGIVERDLPDAGMLNPQGLANRSARIADLAVQLIGRDIHEPRKKVGK
jgi:hypothetical protein